MFLILSPEGGQAFASGGFVAQPSQYEGLAGIKPLEGPAKAAPQSRGFRRQPAFIPGCDDIRVHIASAADSAGIVQTASNDVDDLVQGLLCRALACRPFGLCQKKTCERRAAPCPEVL